MFFLSKPNFTIIDTYPVCIALVRDVDVRTYLSNLSSEIYSYANEYDDLATCKKLNELPKYSKFLPSTNVKNSWLVKLYNYYFSKSTVERVQTANAFYKQIISYNTERIVRRCSYCNANKIDVLDHFLPESKYHALSVNPMNLVPACEHCNDNKSAYEPSPNDVMSVLIHPYYDDILNIDWLEINLTSEIINNVKRIKTSFFVNPAIATIDITLYRRINITLEIIKLNDNICYAADDFINTEILPDFQYGEYLDKSDADLRMMFTRKATNLNQQGYGLNHWKVAIYKFLSTYQRPFNNLF